MSQRRDFVTSCAECLLGTDATWLWRLVGLLSHGLFTRMPADSAYKKQHTYAEAEKELGWTGIWNCLCHRNCKRNRIRKFRTRAGWSNAICTADKRIDTVRNNRRNTDGKHWCSD